MTAASITATTTTPATASAHAVDGITITINEEKKGIEIRFPSKPSGDVIHQLKMNRWRWTHLNGGCWYQRSTPENMTFAQSLLAQ